MKYVFNSTLLRTLPKVLDMSTAAMAEYVTDMVYYTIVRAVKDGDMTLTKLVSLCNGLHLDIRYFFLSEECYIPKAELVVPEEEWEPIVFHGDRIENYAKRINAIKCTHFAWLLNQRNYNIAKILSGGNKSVATDKNDIEGSDSAIVRAPQPIQKTGKAQYNSLLFEYLPQLTGTTSTSIMRSIGKVQAIFWWAKTYKNIRIRTLVSICNNLHVGIDNFFCYSEVLSIPTNIIISASEWEPIVFHPERFLDFLIDKKNNSGVSALCDIMGCSYGKFQRIISQDSTLSATDLVEYCDRLGCSPMYFFDAKVCSEDVHAVALMQSRIKELENKVLRLNAEKLQAESRLRHANAMLEMKGIDRK